MPRFNIDQVRQKLGTTFPTANAAVNVHRAYVRQRTDATLPNFYS